MGIDRSLEIKRDHEEVCIVSGEVERDKDRGELGVVEERVFGGLERERDWDLGVYIAERDQNIGGYVERERERQR